uniref:DNA mismatch repair protein MutL n=1 Tax=Desulfobacca acetoxidans TaxID=60893 RepID=A0A7V4LDZ0_9BACT
MGKEICPAPEGARNDRPRRSEEGQFKRPAGRGRRTGSQPSLAVYDKPGRPWGQGVAMTRIQVLAPHIAALIAAGEVVTRPAAVVKELVENALDAGAHNITVDLEDGGVRRLRVVDDGCGMAAEELPLALQRHATSKIRAETDLLAIQTLGFRGEALPSIAQVSRLEIVTRMPAAQGGMRLRAVAGEIEALGPAPAPEGTQVTVEDLFFNTPVRRKFLKSREAEQAAVVEAMRQLALGYPEVHFRLTAKGRILLAAPGAQTLLERVAAVYGSEVAGALLPFALDGGPLAAAGVLSHPDFSLASSRFQVLLINRRVVQDRLLAAAIKTAYQGLLVRGRHPVVVASLSLPPDQVDVNVHPAKAEVRFRDQGKVFSLLLAALRQGLGKLAGESPPPRYQAAWQPGSLALAQDPGVEPAPPMPSFPRPASPWPLPAAPAEAPPRPEPTPFRFQDLRVIGQLLNTYILAQNSEGLILVDQHAAHERVLYEILGEEAQVPRQALLFPRLVEVSPAQADWVRANLDLLAQEGLVLEPFGGGGFLITQVPACLAQADPEGVVLDLVETLAYAEVLGNRPDTVIVGIEPADISPWGLELTEVVQARLADLCERVLGEIEQAGGSYRPRSSEDRSQRNTAAMF